MVVIIIPVDWFKLLDYVFSIAINYENILIISQLAIISNKNSQLFNNNNNTHWDT